MLPTGKPVPLPAFAPSYGGATAAPYAANPYAAQQQQQQHYPQHPQQQQHAVYGGGYGGVPRPSIVVPPGPQQPAGYGYSPAAHLGYPSPGAYSSSAYSPAGSLVSPVGSGFSSAVSQPATIGSSGYGSFTGTEASGAAALRGSTGSLSELMPGSAAPTPGARRLGDPSLSDPFAGLAPGLHGSLPAASHAPGGAGARYGAPPPTPASGPPFAHPANGSAAPAGFPAAAPFAGAPASSPGMAPATAAATATLYGRAPSLTGYDMSAPAAPKPALSGNPFA